MAATRLRVATYNVHGCIGTDGRHDPDRVARVIAELDADVVALQEFTYPPDVAVETRTPVVLTTLERYEYILGPARQTPRFWFGNVLLTRHPLTRLDRIDLSIKGREARSALAATLDVAGFEVHVLATHLGLRLRERRFQIAQIVEYLEAFDGPLVVLGDFNDWLPGRSVVHALDERLGKPPCVPSFPVARPFLKLDRIWARPCEAVREVLVHRSPLARRASDHYPVVANLEWTNGATSPP